MISCIYTITNLINNKNYVGFAKGFSYRKSYHLGKLRKGTHKNRHLQASWNKYGEENFETDVLVECPVEFLASEEHYWATLLNVHNPKFGYNKRPTHPYGKSRNTKEIIEKTKNTKKLNPNPWKPSIEQRKDNSERIKNRGWTKEEIEKRAKKKRIPIICLNLDGTYNSEYSSAREADSILGISYKAISINLRGKSGRASRYIFIYKSLYDRNKDYTYHGDMRGLIKSDKNGRIKKG